MTHQTQTNEIIMIVNYGDNFELYSIEINQLLFSISVAIFEFPIVTT